ncbi:MAG: GTPase HflX [Planctomycetota bacterium]|jgi:GTP-binding protein HflX
MSQMQREQLNVAAERAVLVQLQLPGQLIDEADPFGELRALTATAGASVVGEMIQRRQKPRGKTYIGKGKVDELAALVKMTGASIVIFDNDLSPAQIRNIEEEICCKIIDRSELILDIFAARASTHAARLQVEIAQLEYTYPRLRAMWDHLGQVTGGAPVGIGTRGPGEQQLEIDRRLARRRLAQLKRELATIQSRKEREVEQRNVDYFTVGLVGYTNAGKSTLFNRLTAGGAHADERLFATLSTRVERWELGGGNHVMLSDTVGFIRDLPHHLVASFKSTLEETINAQLLLVIVDISQLGAEERLDTVRATLDDIDAMEQPRLLVVNKVDAAEGGDLLQWLNRHPEAFAISAKSGEGIDELAEAVRDYLLGGVHDVEVGLELRESRGIDFIEKRAGVTERTYGESSVKLRARLGRRHVEQLLAQGVSFTIDGCPAAEALERWTGIGGTGSRGGWSRPDQGAPPHESYWENGEGGA